MPAIVCISRSDKQAQFFWLGKEVLRVRWQKVSGLIRVRLLLVKELVERRSEKRDGKRPSFNGVVVDLNDCVSVGSAHGQRSTL